jgi:hypothetical protein
MAEIKYTNIFISFDTNNFLVLFTFKYAHFFLVDYLSVQTVNGYKMLSVRQAVKLKFANSKKIYLI